MLANTARELGHGAHLRIWTDAAAARGLALRSGCGAIKHRETKYCCLQQKQKNQELGIEKFCAAVGLTTKHLDGKRFKMLCDLLSIKRISGRPSSAPKLTVDAEYIPRASGALAAMTLVREAAAREIAVPSGIAHETWIDGYKLDNWTATGWRGCHDLLHSCGSGIGMVECWTSR